MSWTLAFNDPYCLRRGIHADSAFEMRPNALTKFLAIARKARPPNTGCSLAKGIIVSNERLWQGVPPQFGTSRCVDANPDGQISLGRSDQVFHSSIGMARDLEQEPSAPLGFVDPVLQQAGGRQIAVLFANSMCFAHV